MPNLVKKLKAEVGFCRGFAPRSTRTQNYPTEDRVKRD